MEYLYLIIGLVLLFFGGKYLVKGAVDIAAYLKVSTLVIGVTIVSFATSAPELAVSVRAALNNQPDISIGNIVGSNISNIALVLALTIIIAPISVKRNSILIDWPIMMAVSILFILFIINLNLQLYEGLIFIIILIGYNYISIKISRKNNHSKNNIKKPDTSIWLSIFFLTIATLALVYGARFLTDGAEQIARNFGVSERVIAVSLVAVGTSIPELATSLIAAIKKEMDISIGNIIGSNIFNILGILGITSIIKPIPVNELTLKIDAFWLVGVSLLLFLFMLPVKNGKLTRLKGIVFLIIYIYYIYLIY